MKSSTWKEIFYLIALAMLIITGIVLDSFVCMGHTLIRVNNYDGISITIIEMQATAVTTTIALISLMSGRITESYMGIKIIDYLFNLKPALLKQKCILIFSILLLSMSIAAYLFQLYNTIFAISIAMALLIVMSALRIYDAYEGSIPFDKEISEYIILKFTLHPSNASKGNSGFHGTSKALTSKYSAEKKLNLLTTFSEDWIQNIDTQSELEYSHFTDVFFKAFQSTFLSNNFAIPAKTKDICCRIAKTLLTSESPNSKVRGIRFVVQSYEEVWQIILADKVHAQSLTTSFHLFGDISFDFMTAIENLPVRKVQQVLEWDMLYELIVRSHFWIAYDNHYIYEIDEARLFARSLGHYLSKQPRDEINTSIWNKVFRNLCISTYNVPEERVDAFKTTSVWMQLNYAIGLIEAQQLPILEEGLYANAMKWSYNLGSHSATLVLSIHCYLYYLAERENTSCIQLSQRSICSDFLNTETVQSAFKYFLHTCAEKCPETFNDSLEQNIVRNLRQFELFPKNENAKILIMDTVVREFIIFCILYLNKHYPHLNSLNNVLAPQLITEHLLFFAGSDTEVIKERFFHFCHKIIGIDDLNVKQYASQYFQLENTLRKRYKDEQIEIASRLQLEYLRRIENVLMKLTTKYHQHFITHFSALSSENITASVRHTFPLLSVSLPTNMVTEKQLLEHIQDSVGALVDQIINLLIKRESIRVVHRNNLGDDQSFLAFLESNTWDKSFIAPEFMLFARHQDYRLFKELKERRKCISVPIQNNCLLLNQNISININQIYFSVRSPKFTEENITPIPETQEYSYQIANKIHIDFTESELTSFLANHKKIIEISADVSVGRREDQVDTIGMVITNLQ